MCARACVCGDTVRSSMFLCRRRKKCTRNTGGRVTVEGRSVILKSAAVVDQSIVVPRPVGTMFTSRRYNRATGPSGETCTMRKGQEKHINRRPKCGGWWDVRWFRVRSAGGTFPTTKRPALTAGGGRTRTRRPDGPRVP